MNFYVIFTFLMGILLLIGAKGKKTGYILLFLLFSLSAFRGENVGTDTKHYMDDHEIDYRATVLTDFTDFKFDNLGGKVEILNNLMLKLVYNLQLDARWIIYFYSFFTFLFFIWAIKRFKVNLARSLIIYVMLGFYFFSLAAARQLCAVSLLLLAYSYLKDGHDGKIKFFLCVLAATLIHSFSIIGLVLYPLSLLKYNKSYVIPVCVISCLLTAIKLDYIQQMSMILSVEHLSDYLEAYGNSEGSNIVGIAFNVMYILFLTYIYLKINWESDLNIKKYSNLFLFSLLFYGSLANYAGLVGRIHYDISIILCPFIAYYFDTNKRNQTIIVVMFMLLYFSFKNNSFLNSLTSDYYLMFSK